MKHIIFIVLAYSVSVSVYSQGFFLTLGAGAINYGGDLQAKAFTLNQANAAFSLSGTYYFDPHFGVSYSLVTGKVGATDVKATTSRYKRNLNFSSNIGEVGLTFEASLKDIVNTTDRFSPYAFGGLAVFRMNPYTFDAGGNKVFLQPLGTEGQGLSQYPDKKPYKLTQLAFPLGVGVKYAISDKVIISAEIAFRKIFTDYLDDVSGRGYADTSILRIERGQLASDLSFRGDELDPPLVLNNLSTRGNPDRKDIYYTCLLKISYFFGKSLFYY